MSKIEKALRRARNDKSLVVVPGGQAVPTSAGGSKDLTAAAETNVNLHRREAATASIARMREPSPRERSELLSRNIILPESAENGTVQAFREIRTKILQRTHGRNCVVMVTSVSGRAGASFVASNLGVAFAFDAGKTALVVDCNLRNPGLQKLFSDPALPGLTDYLESSNMDMAEIIHPVGIERLRVIPAGQKREVPSEYFTSGRMRELLNTLRQRYVERFIIIDAPPMSDTADTQILAEMCDYILLVVPYGKATMTQVDSCIKALEAKKLLGTVFNNEPVLPRFDWNEIVIAPLRFVRDRLTWLGTTIVHAVRKR